MLDNGNLSEACLSCHTEVRGRLYGTRSFKNKRVSLAYDFDTQSLGVDAQTRLGFWRSTLGFGFEREEIGRTYREADTSENKLKLQWRARPSNALSLRLGYLFGDRQADDYNGFVSQISYWYSQAEVGTDHDNPQFTFTNHPDMRRFDVSDRRRNQADLTATFSPRETYSVSASFRYRDDDFDSDVRPTQPLAGRALTDQAAFTPGDQLGMLDDTWLEYSLDAAFNPSERFSWNLFASFEKMDSLQRGLQWGASVLLRDTTRSNQWGNRLVNLGSFLAPGYDGHTIYTLLGYRFSAPAPPRSRPDCAAVAITRQKVV